MRQLAPVAHAFPQAPQLAESFEVVTQRPLHNAVPAGHVQALLVHD